MMSELKYPVATGDMYDMGKMAFMLLDRDVDAWHPSIVERLSDSKWYLADHEVVHELIGAIKISSKGTHSHAMKDEERIKWLAAQGFGFQFLTLCALIQSFRREAGLSQWHGFNGAYQFTVEAFNQCYFLSEPYRHETRMSDAFFDWKIGVIAREDASIMMNKAMREICEDIINDILEEDAA